MKIQNYSVEAPTPSDILIGTNVSTNNATANFRIADILSLTNVSSFKFDDMVGNTLTGVGTLVILSSVMIPANSLTNNCTLDFVSRFLKTDANVTSSTVRLFVNTSNNLTGSTNLAFALGSSTSTRNASFSRTFYIKNSVLRGYDFGSEALTDESNTSFADGSYNIDVTVDNYFMVAVSNVASTSTTSIPYSRYLIYR